MSSTFEGRAKLEMIKREAASRGINPAEIVGVGIAKQNIPPGARTNPLFGPYPPGKSPLWMQLGNKPLGFTEVAPLAIHLPCTSKLLIRSLGRNIYNGLCILFTIYIYYKYIKYLTKRIKDTKQYLKAKQYIRNCNHQRFMLCKKRSVGLF